MNQYILAAFLTFSFYSLSQSTSIGVQGDICEPDVFSSATCGSDKKGDTKCNCEHLSEGENQKIAKKENEARNTKVKSK